MNIDDLVSEIVNLKKEYLTSCEGLKKTIERHVKTQHRILKLSENKKNEDKDIKRSVNSSLQITWTRIDFLESNCDFLHEMRKKAFEVSLLNFLNSNRSEAKKNTAIGILISNYSPSIFAIVRDYMESRDFYDSARQEEEMLKQEIQMLLFRKISKYNPYEGAFYTWLKTVSLNYLKSWGKSNHEPSLPFSEEEYENISSDTPTPEDIFNSYLNAIDLYCPILELNDYPWKIIVYLLSKSKKTAEEILTDFGDLTLGKTLDIIYYDMKCFDAVQFGEETRLTESMDKFKARLDMKVQEVIIPQDYTAKDRLSGIYGEYIGNTKLNDYFIKNEEREMIDPVGSIHDWTGRVGRKLRDAIVSELD